MHRRRGWPTLCAFVAMMVTFRPSVTPAQVENVPISNQIYEFLDRLAIRGIIPLYSNAALPLSRREVADRLAEAERSASRLTDAERRWLAKFQREFNPNAIEAASDSYRIIGPHEDMGGFFEGAVSEREKYLFAIADSNISLFGELLGSMEYRSARGDTYGTTDATLGTIGGRFRGTAKGILGYYLQATNGELWGDRSFAMADKRLASNFKLSEEGAPYFDFTEAYVRLQLDIVHLQFGREYLGVGLGYGDRVVLGNSAPPFDFFQIGLHYQWFRFVFTHGTIQPDSVVAAGLPNEAPPGARKYFVLHRFQFSLFNSLNLGVGEMVVYQRQSPEWAYLNPVNFYKSAEHSLGDKDNALLVFDAELFPVDGYKLYGTWLIDDIDFSKLGTGWWANQFAIQGGAYAAQVAGLPDLDAVVEYTRVNPYVYSNRLANNNYTHSSVPMGHRLDPNSDEFLAEIRYRPTEKLRGRIGYRYVRHGQNVMAGDTVARNVGGSVLVGHREGDSETVTFLDGVRSDFGSVLARIDYEPITNLFLAGVVEYRGSRTDSGQKDDLFAAIQVRLEY